MRNLIYQVWAGKLRPGCEYSEKLFRDYAYKIGAEYKLDIDPNIAGKLCDVPMYFEWLNPLIDDSFLQYDNVLVVDMDIFPVDHLDENIFDNIKDYDCGICTEPFQGRYRESMTIAGHINKKNDEKWARVVSDNYGVTLPVDQEGYLKVYSAGMVLFSRKGLIRAREKFVSFQEYINTTRIKKLGRFYTFDQNYFHAMMCKHLNYCEMDNGWNNYIHYIRGPLGESNDILDSRTKNTKFVHIQLTSADFFDNALLNNIINKPKSKWKLPV